MILICDGPEAAGKTTFAKELSKTTGMPIAHFSYPKTEADNNRMFDMYAEFIYNSPGHIMDRSWYSEMVYGKRLRGKSAINVEQMKELEKLVVSQGGGLLIHCTAPVGKLWERFKRRGDDYIRQDFDLLCELKRDYEKLMHRVPHQLPVVRYEVDQNMSKV